MLKDSVNEVGLQLAITLYEGKVLDGWNRYRVCLDLGIQPHFTHFDGEDPYAYVTSKNAARRHATPGQRATSIALNAKWARENLPQYGELTASSEWRSKSTLMYFRGINGHTPVEQRAAAARVGVQTQKQADSVANADPEVENSCTSVVT